MFESFGFTRRSEPAQSSKLDPPIFDHEAPPSVDLKTPAP